MMANIDSTVGDGGHVVSPTTFLGGGSVRLMLLASDLGCQRDDEA